MQEGTLICAKKEEPSMMCQPSPKTHTWWHGYDEKHAIPGLEDEGKDGLQGLLPPWLWKHRRLLGAVPSNADDKAGRIGA